MAKRIVASATIKKKLNGGSSSLRYFASVGDQLPKNVELHQGWPPKKYNVYDFCKDKSVILLGLPGAFTPT